MYLIRVIVIEPLCDIVTKLFSLYRLWQGTVWRVRCVKLETYCRNGDLTWRYASLVDESLLLKVRVHRPASYAFRMTSSAIPTCDAYWWRHTECVWCVRCVRYGHVDAYLKPPTTWETCLCEVKKSWPINMHCVSSGLDASNSMSPAV